MRQSWRAYLAVICVALCWLSVAFGVLPRLSDPVSFNRVSNPTPPAAGASQASAQVPARSFRGNVYHIILDGYQSEAYQYLLAKTPELAQLPFTYFPNFHTNSGRTYFSLAELFISDFYTPAILPENWHNAAFQSQGMMGYLADDGIRLHEYTCYPEYCYQGVPTVCRTEPDLKRAWLGGISARQTVVDLWFLKLLPTTVKRELAQFAQEDASGSDSYTNWNYGFSILDTIAPNGGPRDGDHSYFSVQQFTHLLENEASRPATGQYVFAHLMLPHGPFSVDSQCNFVGRAERPLPQQEQYLEQVQCAHKLMTLLVKKLESLGRLDNSLIVVHADHGYYWHPADLGVLHEFKALDVSVPRIDKDREDSSKWPSEMIEARSSAVLLIKFPGQTTASRSDKPVEMIDIAPTILRYFDIDPSSMRGIPIQDMPESPVRDRFFFASNAIPDIRNPRLLSKYRYVDGRWEFEENIETFSDANQLFTIRAAR